MRGYTIGYGYGSMGNVHFSLDPGFDQGFNSYLLCWGENSCVETTSQAVSTIVSSYDAQDQASTNVDCLAMNSCANSVINSTTYYTSVQGNAPFALYNSVIDILGDYDD